MKPNHPFSTRLKAARLGIEEATASARMNQYEQGKHLPDLKQAIRFAEALDVPLAYLFCVEDELADLLMQLYKLPEEQRRLLLGQIRGLLASDTASAAG